MSQSETVAFLSSGDAFAEAGPVEVIETHGAYIFLCGDTALKLKREVRYDYMDLSTVELRKDLTLRELALNQPAAPEIYRDVLPVTRDAQGLALSGEGDVVDWVLRMWRFPAEHEVERIAERGALDDALATAMGETVAAYHAAAPVRERSGYALIADIVAELDRVFAEFAGAAGTSGLGAWQVAIAERLAMQRDILDARGAAGHIRRAHGDLHLRNLVLIDGRPVPFDALEFDETLATCDVLYDIAFLIMDLCHRGARRQACRVLEAWLRMARGREDAGVCLLPLFLSVRAAIRAMVLLQTDAARGQADRSQAEVAAYLGLAQAVLAPTAPVLLAVGGYSGSGKSVLARALTAGIGAQPGAVLLSSDLERKAGLPVAQTLDPAAYGVDQRAAVYEQVFARAATLLAAGQSVLLDATFIDPQLRAKAEQIARRAAVPFQGIWLEAPQDVLAERITQRSGDASDADTHVLDLQMRQELGQMAWHRLDASATPSAIFEAARALCRDWDSA